MANKNVITDCTAYIDGTNYFGRFLEFELPEIEQLTADIKSTDSIGEYKLNILKIASMSAKGTLNSFYKDAFDSIANPLGEISMSIYGNIMEFNNSNLSKNTPARILLRGSSSKFKLLGDFKAHEAINYPIEFNLTMAAKYIDGVEKYYIDIPNRIWRINGVDILEQINKNLGLA